MPQVAPESAPTDLEAAAAEFIRDVQGNLHQWRRLHGSNRFATKSPHFEQHDDELIRMLYQLIRRVMWVTPDLIPSLYAQLDGKLKRGRSVLNKPCKQALAVICNTPSLRASRTTRVAGYPDLPEYLLSRQRRNELGDAMTYAARHEVPARYFIAFIRHAGRKRILDMEKRQLWEPGFERLKKPLTMANRRALALEEAREDFALYNEQHKPLRRRN